MTDQELTQEERILRMMKRVLTDVAKDTYTRPGLRHPLSDNTIQGIRDCLSLISARERELAEAAGRPMEMRPRFADEPTDAVVVPLGSIDLKKKPGSDEGDS
jgi:hypothetical protein